LIQSSGNLSAQVFQQLEGLREARKAQIVSFFEERERDLNMLCDIIQEFMHILGKQWNPHRMEPLFREYIREYGYYDLLIAGPEGRILYSVERESDYGTDMIQGQYADSNLGRLIQQVLKTREFALADFAPYAPSGNEPAAFVANPILQGGTVLRVVVLQLSIESINEIMKERTGLGKTGETYLVGGDLLMRSESFRDPVNRCIQASFAHPDKGRVNTAATREALAGNTGEDIILDYNGTPVLSAYTPVVLWDVTWALVAEMDVEEAFAPIHRLTWLISIVGILSILAVVTAGLFIVLLFLYRPAESSPLLRSNSSAAAANDAQSVP
jgi:methyl-accepting chemotaxis protein